MSNQFHFLFQPGGDERWHERCEGDEFTLFLIRLLVNQHIDHQLLCCLVKFRDKQNTESDAVTK